MAEENDKKQTTKDDESTATSAESAESSDDAAAASTDAGGTNDESKGEGDKPEKPKKTRRRRSTKKKAEDTADQKAEDDGEDDKKKPKKSTSRRRSSKKAKDDDTKKAKDDDKKKAKPKSKRGGKKAEKAPRAVHFLTGFPGFIGTRLVKKIAREDDNAEFVLLVEARILERAEQALAEVGREIDGFAKRAEVVTGDITREHLGINPEQLEGIQRRVTTVWHLAAIYDLAVEAQFAYRVNVVGTSNVLDFCEACGPLKRLNYVSTCYVSGDRTGLILETELDEGQGHKNHYERTKFWAEVEVQRRMDRLPAAIFRPGIVVGDSKTGETDKYDGPYYLITFLLRMPSWFPMINVGRGDALVNLVPVDFAVDALTTLGTQNHTEGKVYQLADPNPMRARDIISLVLKILGRRPAVATVPTKLMEKLLDYRRARKLMGMPKEAIVYFNHMARYDVTHTLEDLADTPVRCPHLSTYLSTLVGYVERNPKKEFLDEREL